MPDPALLTERGELYRSWLPVIFRDSPEHLAVVHALAVETERLEDAIETVRLQFFPQTADVLLKAWEFELRTTVEPVGQTVAQRRNTVLALLARSSSETGLDWQANVTRLIGPGWSYEEHIAGDATSPPANTVRVVLPFPPGSDLYTQTERLLRDITPAHLDLQLQFSSGFLLDESQLDQEGLG